MTRARCKGKNAGRGAGPVRSGAKLGLVTVQMLPMAATGLAGFAEFRADFATRADSTPVAVAPLAGTTTVSRNHHAYLHFELPAGIKIPLLCDFGYKCEPNGGAFTLPGGLTFSLGGKSATLTDLAVTYASSAQTGLTATMTGMLDGSAVTVAQGGGSGPSPTDDFLARLGSALGADLFGDFTDFHATFTSTGPLE